MVLSFLQSIENTNIGTATYCGYLGLERDGIVLTHTLDTHLHID